MYTPEQRRVLTVRPGITGPASVEYINENELLGRSPDPDRTYIEEVSGGKFRTMPAGQRSPGRGTGAFASKCWCAFQRTTTKRPAVEISSVSRNWNT